jgi:hypothetical protein
MGPKARAGEARVNTSTGEKAMATKTKPADCECHRIPARDRPFSCCMPCLNAAMDRTAAWLDERDAAAKAKAEAKGTAR